MRRNNSRLWPKHIVVNLKVLSDPEKRESYDLYGDVENIDEDFAEFFEDNFMDLVNGMFNFKLPNTKKMGNRRKPKKNSSGLRNRDMNEFNTLLQQMKTVLNGTGEFSDDDMGDPKKKNIHKGGDDWESDDDQIKTGKAKTKMGNIDDDEWEDED